MKDTLLAILADVAEYEGWSQATKLDLALEYIGSCTDEAEWRRFLSNFTLSAYGQAAIKGSSMFQRVADETVADDLRDRKFKEIGE